MGGHKPPPSAAPTACSPWQSGQLDHLAAADRTVTDEIPLVPMAGLEIGDMLTEDIVKHQEDLP